MIRSLLVCAALLVAIPAGAASDITLSAPNGKSVAINAGELSRLASQDISVSVKGKPTTFAGYDLREVLSMISVQTEKLHGTYLARYVVVTANDGYRVVFSLSELDPTLGATRVYLVNRENGQPISSQDGPWRLIVPNDQRPTRWVRQVQTIRVLEYGGQ